jgi:hypothetical protein
MDKPDIDAFGEIDPLKERVRRIQSDVCLAELYRLVPEAGGKPTTLERLIFGRELRDADGKRVANGTFRHWKQRGSLPGPPTYIGLSVLMSERSVGSGLPLDNRLYEWASHPIWDCPLEEYSPASQRVLLGRLGPEVRRILFRSGDRIQMPDTYFRLARLQTINGFTALLLLSRELRLLDRRIEADVPALLACAIFPEIIRKEVVLRPVQVRLVETLREVFWTSLFARQFSSALLAGRLEKGGPAVEAFDSSSTWQIAMIEINALTRLYLLPQSETGLLQLKESR